MAALLLSVMTHAGAALSLEDVLSRMEQRQQSIQDIRFRYVMHAREGQFQGRSAGEVELKKPGLLKVTQTAPEKQIILTDGSTLWLYSPKQKQVLVGDWNAWVQRSRFPLPLMDFVGGLHTQRWRERFQGTLEGRDDDAYKIRFVSRTPDGEPPVLLWISQESFLPKRGDWRGKGYAAQVRLRDMQTNTGVSDAAFKPQFPPGTEEIPVTF